MTPELATTFATYNARMNDKLYAAAATLSDSDRKAARGAFFGSIHATLSHILWADLTWLARLEGLPDIGGGFGAEIEPEFDVLRQRRTQVDARIASYASSLTAERLGQSFTWTNTKGITRSAPLFILVAHLFNHATHHRGQTTTLLSQLGIDVGVTDLPMVIRE
jgi:uncharacterized damage-inducible protein DinB